MVTRWLMLHWHHVLQAAGYGVIALAGYLVFLPLGVLLTGVALVFISNGW